MFQLPQRDLKKEDIIDILSIKSTEDMEALFREAYRIKEKYIGKIVYYRGLIEFSNICAKNCYYCGIRKDNPHKRYEMTDEEIQEAALFAYENRYGSIVLQSGEREDSVFIEKIIRNLNLIRQKTGGKLGITLCVGEQEEEVYQKFFEAGAHRYLLRIETSSQDFYKTLHPKDHLFERRLSCLKTLKRIGYQTGTGVMIGLPGQTLENLADDLLFFREMDIDMAGMGPYIEHEQTPLYELKNSLETKEERFQMGLKMIALLRIIMKDINIASTTALQTLDPIGREKGLLAGANILMPNITPQQYRGDYLLYQDKPCIGDTKEECKNCLSLRISGIGESIGYNEWGDSRHFYHKKIKH